MRRCGRRVEKRDLQGKEKALPSLENRETCCIFLKLSPGGRGSIFLRVPTPPQGTQSDGEKLICGGD